MLEIIYLSKLSLIMTMCMCPRHIYGGAFMVNFGNINNNVRFEPAQIVNPSLYLLFWLIFFCFRSFDVYLLAHSRTSLSASFFFAARGMDSHENLCLLCFVLIYSCMYDTVNNTFLDTSDPSCMRDAASNLDLYRVQCLM